MYLETSFALPRLSDEGLFPTAYAVGFSLWISGPIFRWKG